METVKQAILSSYATDPTGVTWLQNLARECRTFSESLPVPDDLGNLVSEPKCKYKTNPSREFLRWLIENPDVIVRHTPTEKQNRGMTTQKKRDALFSGCERTTEQALAAVKRFSGSLKGEWWRFEGPIEFDLVLLTDTTFFAIDIATPDRDWPENPRYPSRHYFHRSLDCAMAFASLTKREHFFVAHLAESDEYAAQHRAYVGSALRDSALQLSSMPHLPPDRSQSLVRHFLGVQSIGRVISNSLPNRIAS